MINARISMDMASLGLKQMTSCPIYIEKPRFHSFFQKTGHILPIIQKSKNLVDKSLQKNILSISAKDQPKRTIWGQVISILVIFQISHQKIWLTIEICFFCNIRNDVSRQQRKLFQFRKKQQNRSNKLFKIDSTSKFDPRQPAL